MRREGKKDQSKARDWFGQVITPGRWRKGEDEWKRDGANNQGCTNVLLALGVLVSVGVFGHAAWLYLGGADGISGHKFRDYVDLPDPDGCRCVDDTFGEDCRYKVGTTRSYLPERASALRPCPPTDDEFTVNMSNPGRANAARTLDRAVPHLQNPISCTHGYRVVSYKLYYIPPTAPLLDQIAAAIPGLGDAFHNQKAFQFYPQKRTRPPPGPVDRSFYGDVNQTWEAPPPPPPNFVNPDDDIYCGYESPMTCFFEQASSCAQEADDGSLERGVRLWDPTHEINIVPGPVVATEKKMRRAYGKGGAHDFTLAVPKMVEQYGMYWYHAQLLRWLWRPTQRATELMNVIRDSLRLQGRRCIAAFVPPDCTPEQKERGCVDADIGHIFEAVGELSRRYEAPTVYLDTDSMRAVAATARFPKLEWVHIGGNSSWALYRHLNNNQDPPEPQPEWLGGGRFAAPPPAPLRHTLPP
mmetsp:Transcript_42544/g.136475  ORF Transcript_42544/g.136475 Transcript_42544/m.136475 type:complete len:469 (-) Transcript_42544:2429-3835(-)